MVAKMTKLTAKSPSVSVPTFAPLLRVLDLHCSDFLADRASTHDAFHAHEEGSTSCVELVVSLSDAVGYLILSKSQVDDARHEPPYVFVTVLIGIRHVLPFFALARL